MVCKSKNKFKIKIIAIFSVIILAIILILIYLNYVVNPIIIEMSQSKVQALAQKAVSSAIFEVINDSALYDSLITITRNEQVSPIAPGIFPKKNVHMLPNGATRLSYVTR